MWKQTRHRQRRAILVRLAEVFGEQAAGHVAGALQHEHPEAHALLRGLVAGNSEGENGSTRGALISSAFCFALERSGDPKRGPAPPLSTMSAENECLGLTNSSTVLDWSLECMP